MARFIPDRVSSVPELDAPAPTEIIELLVRDVRTPGLEFIFKGSTAAMIEIAQDLCQEDLVEISQRAADPSLPSSPVRSRIPPCSACSDFHHTFLSCPLFVRGMAQPTYTAESRVSAPQPTDLSVPNRPYYTPPSPDYSPLSPDYTPLSPDYTPASPIYTPSIPLYAPFTSDYIPFSPKYSLDRPDDVPDDPRS